MNFALLVETQKTWWDEKITDKFADRGQIKWNIKLNLLGRHCIDPFYDCVRMKGYIFEVGPTRALAADHREGVGWWEEQTDPLGTLNCTKCHQSRESVVPSLDWPAPTRRTQEGPEMKDHVLVIKGRRCVINEHSSTWALSDLQSLVPFWVTYQKACFCTLATAVHCFWI